MGVSDSCQTGGVHSVLELSVKRRVCFISHIISLIMFWCMEVNNIVPSAAIVQGQQSIEFTHCFPTLKHAWRIFFFFSFSCFCLLWLTGEHTGLWIHAYCWNRSQWFMTGRWFNGGICVNGWGTERRQIKEHRGLLQQIYEECHVHRNTGFSFRMTLSESWSFEMACCFIHIRPIDLIHNMLIVKYSVTI